MLPNFHEGKTEFPRKRKWSEVPGIQRLVALVFILISIIVPIVNDGDATISVIFMPLGIYLLVTKEEVVHL